MACTSIKSDKNKTSHSIWSAVCHRKLDSWLGECSISQLDYSAHSTAIHLKHTRTEVLEPHCTFHEI